MKNLKLFLLNTCVGLGASLALDATLAGNTLWAVIFAALTVYCAVFSWLDLRDTRAAEADLEQAEHDIDLLIEQGADHAGNAGYYVAALMKVRDALLGRDSTPLIEIVDDALAEQHDPALAIQFCVDTLVTIFHDANKHWWKDAVTGQDIRDNPYAAPCKLMLIVSEVAEAMEAHRKSLPDDKLPHFDGFTVELADALIRICDLAGAYRKRLGKATAEKNAFNANRLDHKREARAAEYGKAY